MVILDTCALIELCQFEPRISTATQTYLEEGSHILSVSLAEIACKLQMKKLQMDLSAEELYIGFSQLDHVVFVDISVEHWLNAVALDWPENKDPADRLITAYAIQEGLSIVSSDKKMKKFYKQVIW